MRILDAGCGSGVLLHEIERQQRHAFGIDLSLAMAAIARRRLGHANVVVADAEVLPFIDHRFDAVLSSSSFHFWPDQRTALGEIHRVLRPDGRVVITDWCDDYIACRLCDAFLRWRNKSKLRILKSGEIKTLLSESRFKVQSVDCYKISWFWGLMTAVAVRA